jgi:heterodisulfide reductase subunit C
MRVKLSAETLSNELVRRIEEISGEDLMKCYQCGMCAAGCPAAFAMDMLPSQLKICYAARGLLDITLRKIVKRLSVGVSLALDHSTERR